MRNQNLAGNAFPFIQSWAAQTPDAIALLAPGRSPLTFSGLLRRIEATELALNQYGIGPNEIVALAMPDGAEMAAAAIAVGRTRACAPLNPSFAVSECDYCLHSLMPAALMAPRGIESAATAAARALAIPILDVHTEPDAPAGSFDLNLRSNIRPARGRDGTGAAILLFTSATTGKPKLVPLSHANLNAICRNTNLAIQLSPEDRFLNMMPQFHLQALASILVQWYAGGSVVCTQGFDPSGFRSWIVDFQPTWYTAGPTLHRSILTLLGRSPLAHRLRFLRSIGAPMTPELILALEELIGVPVLEGYGLTETGLATSNPLPPMRRKPGSVGVPFGTEVNILDSSGGALPADREGEIVLRGPAVTSGYLDPVDANAAAFINGWLRTGDLGRMDEDGYLYITGRLKEIINRGGEKIMPQEIDRALAAHPAVADAAAFAVPHATLGEDVMAGVVLRHGATVSELMLREFAAARIAHFKVPRRILFVEKIPKGSTGKTNRIALCEQLRATATAPGAMAEAAAESDDLIRGLTALWAEMLSVSAAGVHDNFFEMGGDSLMAATLVLRIEQRFGKKLPLDALFHAPTPAGIAHLLREPDAAAALSRIVSMQPVGSRIPFFMVRPMPIYRSLARRFLQDRPFLGITLPEGRRFVGKDTLAEIAADMAGIMRERQPVGPYCLGGWCADGMVAYEMARQLEAAGEQIQLLALFDSLNPEYMPEFHRRQFIGRFLNSLKGQSKFHLACLRQLDLREIPDYVMQRLKAFSEMVRAKWLVRQSHSQTNRDEIDMEAWRPSGMRIFIRGYRPKPLKGPTVLFRSASWLNSNAEDANLGWDAMPGSRLTVHRIPGDHVSIFLEPNVGLLAEKLAESLAAFER